MNTDLMLRILWTQSASRHTERMADLIAEVAEGYGATVWRNNGNVYAEKGGGDVRPCIVAHMDTVFSIIPDDHYRVGFHEGKWYAWNMETNRQTGVGGDDKVGIYVALDTLRRMDNIKVAFFRDEEIGCLGSAVADMTFFDDVGFVLQCDRRGYGEFISDAAGVELHDDEFGVAVKPYLDTYGFKGGKYGSITDVMELKDGGLKVAAANMSCGYYNYHSNTEYILREDVERVAAMVYRICAGLGSRSFPHTYTKKTYDYRGYGYTSYSSRWTRDDDATWWTDYTARYGESGIDYVYLTSPDTNRFERYNITERGCSIEPNARTPEEFFALPKALIASTSWWKKLKSSKDPRVRAAGLRRALYYRGFFHDEDIPVMNYVEALRDGVSRFMDSNGNVWCLKDDVWSIERNGVETMRWRNGVIPLGAGDEADQYGSTDDEDESLVGRVRNRYGRNTYTGTITRLWSDNDETTLQQVMDRLPLKGHRYTNELTDPTYRYKKTGHAGLDGECPMCNGETLMYDDTVPAWYCMGECDGYTVFEAVEEVVCG